MAADLPLHVFHIVPGRLRQVLPLPDAKPVMTAMLGWKCDISGVRTWEDLPQAARDYVEYVEQAIGCHIGYVSVGAERESLIIR